MGARTLYSGAGGGCRSVPALYQDLLERLDPQDPYVITLQERMAWWPGGIVCQFPTGIISVSFHQWCKR
ncbi:hypothetical protein SYNPCC7002_A0536 [Picosynechococcus sp. PCC 7002]|nr:hypothetical protein SYNPCC7002_A0536 [Picosynechococcus sp. PCC 7002]